MSGSSLAVRRSYCRIVFLTSVSSLFNVNGTKRYDRDNVLWLLLQVARVALMSLKNLVKKGNFGSELVELGFPKIIDNLRLQAWNDEVVMVAANAATERVQVLELISFVKG